MNEGGGGVGCAGLVLRCLVEGGQNVDKDGVICKALKIIQPLRILEFGCGTGRNLLSLRKRIPRAAITGLDLSEHMLDIARRKIRDLKYIQRACDSPLGGFDLILCSHALSMFDLGWDHAIG